MGIITKTPKKPVFMRLFGGCYLSVVLIWAYQACVYDTETLPADYNTVCDKPIEENIIIILFKALWYYFLIIINN